MMPILFDANTQNFSNNGLGVLTDCISCLVTEARNGEYEVEFQYPVNGQHYGDITEGKIIYVDHDETGDKQPFIIYHRSLPFNGVCTFNAHHWSYKLNGTIVAPFTASSVGAALTGFQAYAITENPFTFWTDKSSSGTFTVKVPSSIRSLLGGTEGSILDAFGGGEYEFDHNTVKLHASRGSDNGVTIRYGKNLSDLKQDIDTLDLYNSVIPYWQKEDTVVYGGIVKTSGGVEQQAYWTNQNGVQFTDEDGTPITFTYKIGDTRPLDLSQEFDDEPTKEQIEARALAFLNANTPWIPKVSLDIDFVQLWQTEEYKDIAPLERVKLCDTVTVYYPEFGVNVKAKVTKVVWDALAERYSKMEIGDTQASFGDVIQQATDAKLSKKPDISEMELAIDHATELITGAAGGYIVYRYDANGKPTEQLIMDTDDVNTAVNVWRFNMGGLGHSHSGVNGPYNDVALTQDGQINASMITAGVLNASIIQAGILRSRNWLSYWDLEGSEFCFYDEDNDKTIVLDKGVIDFYTSDEKIGQLHRVSGVDKDGNTVEFIGIVHESTGAYKSHLSVADGMAWLSVASDTNLYEEPGFARIRTEKSGLVLESDYGTNSNTYAQIVSGNCYINVNGKTNIVSIGTNYNTDNNLIQISENNGRIYLKCTDLLMNGYTGHTGTVTISGHTFTFKNGICTNIT